MSPSRIIKCVTVGDGSVGNLLKTYGSNTVPMDYIPTVFDNFSANVEVKGANVFINLGFWETSEQQDDCFNSLRPLSYRDAEVFILAFSLISKASYEDVSNRWIPELKQYAPSVPIVLVGTKLDLRENADAETISTAQGEELKEKIGAIAYIECCSNSHQNVKQVFDAVMKVVLYPMSQKKSKGKGKLKACSILCSALCIKKNRS